MAKVAYYEINVDDFRRAQTFYAAIFGWTFDRYPGPMEYYLVKSGEDKEHGIDGGMLMRQAPLKDGATSGFVCTIAVSSVDDAIAKIKKAGGVIVMEKTLMEGIGYIAYAIDTEGNTFGIWERA